jgi:hypothetical protein
MSTDRPGEQIAIRVVGGILADRQESAASDVEISIHTVGYVSASEPNVKHGRAVPVCVVIVSVSGIDIEVGCRQVIYSLFCCQ